MYRPSASRARVERRSRRRRRGRNPSDRASSDFGSDLLVERVRDDAPNKAFAGCVILTRESVPDAVLSERRVDRARDDDVGAVGRGGVFDAFSLLPATLPRTDSTTMTIGILGLGAGTCARVLSAHHPRARMVGWELDPAIVDLARRHFGVDELGARGDASRGGGRRVRHVRARRRVVRWTHRRLFR